MRAEDFQTDAARVMADVLAEAGPYRQCALKSYAAVIAGLLASEVGEFASAETYRNIARALFPPPIDAPEAAGMREICKTIAEQEGFTVDDIRGVRRNASLCRARWRAMHALYETNRYSTTKIGIFLNRDHSTVIYGIRQHRRRLAQRMAAE